ncbi:DUF551 domain-containing protein [Acinetobacter baumannii]|uniref:DUF551 domain-containing protein n=1 Tax=Acinetobacter baumannii TaxID=470 RepID=UPI00385A353A
MDWIKLDKQKPNEGQAVIVWIDKPQSPPNIKTGIYHKWQSYCDGKMTAEGDSFTGLSSQDESQVKLWQPLLIHEPKT